MTAGPALSVLVVTHESSSHLLECLASIDPACGGLEREVIVIDSASRDDSVELARRSGVATQIVRLARNRGYAAALNAGVALARGRAIAFCNSDLVFGAGCLAKLARATFEEDAISAAGPVLRGRDGREAPFVSRFPTVAGEAFEWWLVHRIWPGNPVRARGGEMLCGALFVATAAVVGAVGPFDERFFLYHEEADWFGRAAKLGLRPLRVAAAEATHIGGGSSGSRDDMLAAWVRSQYLFHALQGGRPALLGLAFVQASGVLLRQALWSARQALGEDSLKERLELNWRHGQELPEALALAWNSKAREASNRWYPDPSPTTTSRTPEALP